MLGKSLFLIYLFLAFQSSVYAQDIAFETDPNHNKTATYEELISFYEKMANEYAQAKLIEIGATDVGKPLHLFVMSADQDFDPQSIRNKNKAILLINNGIHPGEPEGMDASMMLVRHLLVEKKLSNDVVICIIPVYNVSGMLNRGQSRVNQNGPEAYGFRGSRQNYDLNRDFVKADTRNSMLFQYVFTTWDPDVFVDTHTSNGADYQYIMTLIATQKDKLHPDLSKFMQDQFTKPLYQRMEKTGFPMIPYVNTKGETPESGLVDFLETPRYSTGYAALHHTIGYMPETHMWKPYQDRVLSTYSFLNHVLDLTTSQHKPLVQLRRQVKESVRQQEDFPVAWQLDTSQVESIPFLGYEAGYKTSDISGKPRLYYDREKPINIRVPYYRHYNTTLQVKKPKAYLIPQSYDRIIDILRLNGVEMSILDKDTIVQAEMYYITSYKTNQSPYEGHYMHHSVEIKPVIRDQIYYKGDWIITMDQSVNRYLIETLEPQSADSFFNWNFFDAILAQKEYFSSYIFEDEAHRLLQENPDWKKELEDAKKNDSTLASNPRAQLDWIYKKSAHYEDTHLLYPIARILE